MSEKISFWLIPVAEARSFFQETIDRLANQYNAPTFTPHVTLCYGDFPIDTLSELIQQSVPATKVVLQIDRLLHTEQFTKTLFVQFQPSSVLSRISSNLAQGAIVPSNYQLNPHLSLIYQALTEAKKQELVGEIFLPFAEVEFDQIWATSTPSPVQSREDVEAWRVLHTFKLIG